MSYFFFLKSSSLCFTFKFIIPRFSVSVRLRLRLVGLLFLLTVVYSSTICWKGHLSIIELLLHLYQTQLSIFIWFFFCTLWSIDLRVSLPVPHSLDYCQFSSVQLLSHVQLFASPWTAARQASLSITKCWSPYKPMCIVSVMPSNHLILCGSLLLLPSVFPSISLFKWVNSSHQVAEVLEFQLQYQSFQWTPRTDLL